MINYRQIILNLRGAGCMSAREVSNETGIAEAKLYRMASGGAYTATDRDMIMLLDLHYDVAPHLHNKRLLA